VRGAVGAVACRSKAVASMGSCAAANVIDPASAKAPAPMTFNVLMELMCVSFVGHRVIHEFTDEIPKAD
jgi:hypothetical protein